MCEWCVYVCAWCVNVCAWYVNASVLVCLCACVRGRLSGLAWRLPGFPRDRLSPGTAALAQAA